MTLTHYITLIAVLVPTVTALLVAYWHRKQMRQIELFRLDSAVGLTPPPSRLFAFARAYKYLLTGVGLPLISLALELTQSTPVTRRTVLIISWNTASMLVAVTLHFVFRLTEILGRTVDFMGGHAKPSEKIADIVLKDPKTAHRA